MPFSDSDDSDVSSGSYVSGSSDESSFRTPAASAPNKAKKSFLDDSDDSVEFSSEDESTALPPKKQQQKNETEAAEDDGPDSDVISDSEGAFDDDYVQDDGSFYDDDEDLDEEGVISDSDQEEGSSNERKGTSHNEEEMNGSGSIGEEAGSLGSDAYDSAGSRSPSGSVGGGDASMGSNGEDAIVSDSEYSEAMELDEDAASVKKGSDVDADAKMKNNSPPASPEKKKASNLDSSDSEEISDSDSPMAKKAPTPAPVPFPSPTPAPAPAPAKKKSYFDDSSSEDESTMGFKAKASKPAPTASTLSTSKKKKSSYFSDSDEDDESTFNLKTETLTETKSAIATASKKKSYLGSASDDVSGSSSSSSSSHKKVFAPAPAPPPPPKKKSYFSDSDESSSFKVKANTPTPAPKKSSFLDSSDSDESSSSPIVKSKAKDKLKLKKKSFLDSDSDLGGDSSSGSTNSSPEKTAATNSNAKSASPKQCAACGQDAEFTPDGLVPCDACHKVQYCSSECAQWHFDTGGHDATCSGGSLVTKKNASMKDRSMEDSQESIDVLAPEPEEPAAPSGGIMAALKLSREQAAAAKDNKCKSCGMDAEFVSDGMISCPKCQQGVYCSTDCQQWDWESGGHQNVCRGITEAERKHAAAQQRHPKSGSQAGAGSDDDGSIEAFDLDAGGSVKPPEDQGGVMAALAKSRAEAATSASVVSCTASRSNQSKPAKCASCGMEEEFVPDGMIKCLKCQSIQYCSTDCMKWHWDSGHKKVCSGLSEAERQQSLANAALVSGGDSDSSIDPFSSDNDDNDGTPQSQGGIMAAIAASRAESAKNKRPAAKLDKCKACDMDREFVPEGMKMCPRCSQVAYCSSECMEWHWESGGHSQECPGLTDRERKAEAATKKQKTQSPNNSEGSIDAFDPATQDAPQSTGGIMAALANSRAEAAAKKKPIQTFNKCKACGMDAEFVPDGMIKCKRCSQIPYCSSECMEWHWESGGHKSDCTGRSNSDKRQSIIQKSIPAPMQDSDGSIDLFASDDQNASAPMKGGVMAALAASRAEAAACKQKPTLPQDKCVACGMDAEFVPEGMITCNRCSQVPYCSSECMEWHWESGGHKNDCSGRSNTEKKQSMIKSTNTTPLHNSDGSIDPFDSVDGNGTPKDSGGVMAALAASRAEAAAKKQPKISPVPQKKCTACGMDAEFVPEGMITCNRCFSVPYCSNDCLEWHWENEHKKNCTGRSETEKQQRMVKSSLPMSSSDASDGSIDLFDHGATNNETPQTKGGIMAALAASRAEAATKKKIPALPMDKCIACGMEKDFVPEGMKTCPRCLQMPYCSKDCMEWHWKNGGHSKECTGISETERKQQKPDYDMSMDDESDESIDVLDPIEDESPKTKQGILEALSRARSENAAPAAKRDLPVDPNVCRACGIDFEFVGDARKLCPKCFDVPYCSKDCMSWDWDNGGHKAVCKGASESEWKPKANITAHGSPVFKGPGGMPLPSNKCKACGMEKEFVPEGMQVCPRCNQVVYCSEDCRTWDWESGHKDTCPGFSDAERRFEQAMVDDNASEDSIDDPFAANDDKQAPQSKEGVLAALSNARAQVSPDKKETSSSTPSLRDQITGGNDRLKADYVAPAPTPAYDVNMLKLELERIKRQYNDAMISKASLERRLGQTSMSSSIENVDEFRDAVDSFLRRLESLLNTAQKPGHQEGADRHILEPNQNGLANLESKIQYLIDQRNKDAAETNALRIALKEVESKSRLSPPDLPAPMAASTYHPVGSDRDKGTLLRDLSDRWDELAAESDALREELQNANEDKERLKVANEYSNRLVLEKEELLEKVCAAIVDLEKEVARMVDEQEILERENETLNRKLDVVTNERNQLQSLQAASEKLLAEKEALVKELCDVVADLESKVSQLGDAKNALEEELGITTSVLAKHRQARQKLEKSFLDAENEIVGLRGHLRHLDTTEKQAAISQSASDRIPIASSMKRPRFDYSGQSDGVRKPSILRTPAPFQPSVKPYQTKLPSFDTRVGADSRLNRRSPFGPFGKPSEREDAVGQAIRERVGIANQQQRDVEQEAWIRSTPPRQRDDVREPVGERFAEDYNRPMPSHLRNSSQAVDNSRFSTAKFGSQPVEVNREARKVSARQLSAADDSPYKRKPRDPFERRDYQTLTPTEQRVAHVQQRIADAVESARQNVVGAASSTNGRQVYRGPEHTARKSILRPNYGSVPRGPHKTLNPSVIGGSLPRSRKGRAPSMDNFHPPTAPQHPRQYQTGVGGPPTRKVRVDLSGALPQRMQYQANPKRPQHDARNDRWRNVLQSSKVLS